MFLGMWMCGQELSMKTTIFQLHEHFVASARAPILKGLLKAYTKWDQSALN